MMSAAKPVCVALHFPQKLEVTPGYDFADPRQADHYDYRSGQAVTRFDGEVMGDLMTMRVPLKWMAFNLGDGPTKIFCAAARHNAVITRGPAEPDRVACLFKTLEEGCGLDLEELTWRLDEKNQELLACGRTTKTFD